MPKPTDPPNFEISSTDLKLSTVAQSSSAFLLRSELVMLASDVALIFQVETREIVQNIKTNPKFFPERYAFELTQNEVETLRSVGLIPKPGRGGSRALPWAVTRKGVMRLATIMKTERAIEATDIFIDVFDEVLRQMQSGKEQLTIANPSRLIVDKRTLNVIDQMRQQLVDAVSSLLNTVVDAKAKTTVAEELQEISGEAVNHLKAWLKGKSLANDKIEAETLLIIEQAQDMYERRKADMEEKALDRERKTLENLQIRIKTVKEVMELYRELEPSALVVLTRSFASPMLTLPTEEDQP